MFNRCIRPLLRTGLCLLLGIAGVAAQPRGEPVGLVTELQGSGEATQKHEGGPLELLRELWPGAVVALPKGARAVVVHMPTGVVYELSGPGRFRVQAKAIEPLEGAKLSRRELPPELKAYKLKPVSSMQASIVMRGAAPARLEGPSGGVLGTEELNYRVRGTFTIASVDVVEVNGGVARLIQDAGPTFNPASAIEPRSGVQYLVRVKGTDARGKATELSSRFWLIDSETGARLKAARPGASASQTDLIVYAMALETAGATASARAAWDMINERR